MTATLTKTELDGLSPISTGKVRDIYEFEDKLLLVATDRISAFDVIFNEGISNKGAVLTQLAAYWFERTRDIVDNHLITAQFDELPESLRRHEELRGRATLCHKAEVIPFECVVRGYLEGSGWKEYQRTGAICGVQLPEGLERRSRLPEPIFTPATKAEEGHDINVTFEYMAQHTGVEVAERAREIAIGLYEFAYDHLDAKDVVLADTKFEIGFKDGKLILIDEALTPDSSRFWVKGSVSPEGQPISYDKQFVRDFLETTDWDKTYPPPTLPAEVIEKTSARYVEIYEKITGRKLEA